MKNLHTLCALAATLMVIAASTLALTSCKSKPKADPNKPTTEIKADAVTAIRVTQAINVKFKQAEGAPQITVTCHKDYAENLDVHMEGTTLVAGYRSRSKVATAGVDIVITAPAINDIEATEAAVVNLGDEYKITGDLRIACTKAGSVRCKKLTCQNLNLSAAEASVIQLQGINVANVTARASMASLILLDGKATSCDMLEGSASEIRYPKLETQHNSVNTFAEKTDLTTPEPAPAAPAKPTAAPTSTTANN